VRDRLTYAMYAVAWTVVRRLPERVAYAAFARGADLAWRRRGRGVRQLEANLRRARPDADDRALRALSRAALRSYLRYWCDVFRLPDWSAERVVSTVRVVGEEHLRTGTGPGARGVVGALMHLGNWDHAGAWAALTGVPVVTVAERLRPERLYARFLAYREELGMEIVPLTGHDEDVTDLLVRRLKDGRLVPLLADRDLRASGVPVDLLGEPTRMPAGPALLALRTGSALHPVSIWHEDAGGFQPRLVIRFHDEVVPPAEGPTRDRVSAMTQQVADVFGAAISEHADEWHMLQPLWLADLDPVRLAPVGGGPR
jgi:KDO2-lipid IV(A) lauroyltransferase